MVEFYATPAAMTELPTDVELGELPSDLDAMRATVQGLLVHRDWCEAYGVKGDDVRLDDQNLRSTKEVLRRAVERAPKPIMVGRMPVNRVQGICSHFASLYVALLRAQGIPARMRGGFANYFDRSKWYDHWIAERWDGSRWVRDDPQIDAFQTQVCNIEFDPYDQPPGEFLDASQAWIATRNGELDASLFGIFDMWGAGFISGNVVTDFACLNKVELLPWDAWSPLVRGTPDSVPHDIAEVFDELAALVVADDVDAIRDRYANDERLRVPPVITTFNGPPREVRLDL